MISIPRHHRHEWSGREIIGARFPDGRPRSDGWRVPWGPMNTGEVKPKLSPGDLGASALRIAPG